MRSRVREYGGEGVTVSYDVQRCIHAKECVHSLPRVFDVNRRVWVDAAQASPDDVAAVIERCPTGALHHRRKDGGVGDAIRQRNEIRVVPDGPLALPRFRPAS